MNVALLAKEAPPAWLIIVGLIVLVIYYGLQFVRSRALNVTLRNVARKAGGTVTKGGFFNEPSLELTFGERNARLEFWGGSKHNSPYSKVVVRLGCASPGVLHILKDGFGQSFLKVFGAQDLQIGNATFDREYVIKAVPSGLAKRLFSPDRQGEGIRIVRRLQGYANPTFDLDAQTLTVRVYQYLREQNQILTLIECARDFTAFVLRPAEPAGVALEEVRVATGGECPVCGTPMNDLTVRCGSCRTPHHAECWQYMGRCSTYACPGTKFVA